MSISPATYSSGYLLQKMQKMQKEKENPRIKDCPVCHRGMYKIPRTSYIECENCECREESQ